jgi:hypothetical protein
MDVVKPGGRDWVIKEQIITDPSSGITLQFEVLADGRKILRVLGDALPFGNQEIAFGNDGARRWTRVGIEEPPRATWLRKVP